MQSIHQFLVKISSPRIAFVMLSAFPFVKFTLNHLLSINP
nr:MAG TPA: hypothetical protein [Caudoviricetes sp.]